MVTGNEIAGKAVTGDGAVGEAVTGFITGTLAGNVVLGKEVAGK